MIRNEDWNVIVRTSMNLNKNQRLEYAEISDDATFADFLDATISEIFEDQPDGGWIDERPQEAKNQFAKLGIESGKLAPSNYGSDLYDPMRPGISPWPTD